ncbi:hypothetical protein GCM10010466_63210 [Planomonospora alba]|uniref:Uncharacterized protein n=1 Tax=Planomonospora alba TaxID=161354 RepID=A0ABP6P091_9ACTN
MILISAGLVLTAVVLLIAGVVLTKPFLVMWSIAVSVLSAVFLVIGALLRRHELFPGRGRAGAAPPSPFPGAVPAGAMPVPPMAPHQHPVPGAAGVPGAPAAAPQGVRQAAAARPRPAAAAATATRQGVPDAGAIVLVIPGRRRYHLPGCRQLAGRDHEELTQEEAREEGFTPCTTCLPDTGAAQDGPGAHEPARSPASTPQAFQDSGPSGAGGPAEGETARFTPPYRPVAAGPAPEPSAPAGEGSAAAGRSGREAATASAAPEPAATEAADRPETAARRVAEPAGGTDGDAAPERAAERETPAARAAGTAEAAAAAGRAAAGAPQPAGTGTADGPRAGSTGPEPAGAEPAEPDGDGPGADEPEATAVWRVPAAAGEKAGPERAGGRESPAAEAAAGEAADRTTADAAEPVEPAGTEPGRAGRPVPTGSTSAGPEPSPEPSADADRRPAAASAEESQTGAPPDDDTSPHGIPVIGSDAAETVSVIAGTRRFHTSTCPLIKGVDDDGVESMSRAEAEKAGLSGCAVCQNDPA